jgi:catechol 2,3-dioxygenase-like lactoylglutathione lyase family enzyme
MGQGQSTFNYNYAAVWLAGLAAGVLVCKAQSGVAPRNLTSHGMPPAGQACTFINCSSLQDCIDFYQKVLELELVYEQKGFVAFFRLTSGSFICVCLRQNRESDFIGDAKGAIVSLVFGKNAEIDAWHTRLAAKVAPGQAWSIEKTPSVGVSSDGKEIKQIYNMFLRDPSGYLIEYEVIHDSAWPSA